MTTKIIHKVRVNFGTVNALIYSVRGNKTPVYMGTLICNPEDWKVLRELLDAQEENNDEQREENDTAQTEGNSEGGDVDQG